MLSSTWSENHNLNINIETGSNDGSEKLSAHESSISRCFSSRNESISSTSTTSSTHIKSQENPADSEKNILTDPSNAKTDAKVPKKSKISHNKIEKKYRTNINTKFIELKDAVPTLRILDSHQMINFDELEGLAPASRLNKANILSKATEYIKHLELKNKALIEELRIVKSNPNYVYKPQNSLHHLPIEVISNLPNQPRMSHLVLPDGANPNSFQIDANSFAPNGIGSTNNIINNNIHPSFEKTVDRSSYGYKRTMQSTNSSESSTNSILNNDHESDLENGDLSYLTSTFQHRDSWQQNSRQNNYHGDILNRRETNYANIDQGNSNLGSNPHLYSNNQYTSYHNMNDNSNNIMTTHTNANMNANMNANTNMNMNMASNISSSIPPQHNIAYNPEQDNNPNLARNIMVGGIASIVGSNFISNFANNTSSNYHSLSATPLVYIAQKSIKLTQLISLFSCLYYFLSPLLHTFMNWKRECKKNQSKEGDRTLMLSIFVTFIRYCSSIPNSNPNPHLTSSSENISSTATNQAPEVFPIDLTSFPITLTEILFAYVKILNVSDCSNRKSLKTLHSNLANPVEHTFNKIVLLVLILKKFPLIGHLLGFESRIKYLIDSLLDLSKSDQSHKFHSSIIKFISFDKNFINSHSINNHLAEILTSLSKTKSSKLTADILYGANIKNSGCGYNSIHEYLINTPTNKLNLFELVSALWCIENIRARMVKFLSDTIEYENSEQSQDKDDIRESLNVLLSEMEEIEHFIPIQCIKLIKCCKIFKSLLNPNDENYLNDALKLILVSVEKNLISIKRENETTEKNEICDNLLSMLHLPIPVLPKVLQIIKTIQNSTLISSDSHESEEAILLISDENRLSLLCSIILHQYSIGNFRYGRSLIKYLKSERTRKFMCSDSISLMSLIATFSTLTVVLNHRRTGDLVDDSDDFQDAEVYEMSVEELERGDCSYEERLLDSSDDEFGSDDEDLHASRVVHEDNDDCYILEDLLCGLRLYVGQGSKGQVDDSVDYDILSLHYGLQSDLSHKLLELAKELVGYSE